MNSNDISGSKTSPCAMGSKIPRLIPIRNNSKQLNGSPTYTASPVAKTWFNKKIISKKKSGLASNASSSVTLPVTPSSMKNMNSVEMSSFSYASNVLSPPSASSMCKEKRNFVIKINSAKICGSMSHVPNSGDPKISLKKVNSKESGLSSYASLSILPPISKKFVKPPNVEKTGSLKRINSKEIRSFSYTSCSPISVSSSLVQLAEENSGSNSAIDNNSPKQISGLYSDSAYSLTQPSVFCYFNKPCSRGIPEPITPKLEMRTSQKEKLDEKIYLRTMSLFPRKTNKGNLKEHTSNLKLDPKHFTERYGLYSYVVSQISIPETASQQFKENSEISVINSTNFLESISPYPNEKSHSLMPKIKPSRSIELAASFYGPKILMRKKNSRQLNQKLGSSTPSEMSCVSTDDPHNLHSINGSHSFSKGSIHIVYIIYAFGFLLFCLSRAFKSG